MSVTWALDMNGHLVLDPEMRLYEAMMAIARHELDKAGLASLLIELAGEGPSGA